MDNRKTTEGSYKAAHFHYNFMQTVTQEPACWWWAWFCVHHIRQLTTKLSQQVRARLGDYIFCDCVEWNLSNPYNTAEQYSSQICKDLGLGLDWFTAINREMNQRLNGIRQVKKWQSMGGANGMNMFAILWLSPCFHCHHCQLMNLRILCCPTVLFCDDHCELLGNYLPLDRKF